MAVHALEANGPQEYNLKPGRLAEPLRRGLRRHGGG